MARKTNKKTIHDFTSQIHSTRRKDTMFANMSNWNERKAKAENKVGCSHCRFFALGCSEFIGRWHQPCSEFEWW
jgi:hypothetical protein